MKVKYFDIYSFDYTCILQPPAQQPQQLRMSWGLIQGQSHSEVIKP